MYQLWVSQISTVRLFLRLFVGITDCHYLYYLLSSLQFAARHSIYPPWLTFSGHRPAHFSTFGIKCSFCLVHELIFHVTLISAFHLFSFLLLLPTFLLVFGTFRQCESSNWCQIWEFPVDSLLETKTKDFHR